MPQLNASQKAERVLLLLMGLRDDRIALPLRDAGFTAADIEEGWTLLRRQTRCDFDDLPSADAGPVGSIEAIGAWHKTWFQIAASILVRQYPAVHDVLFGDLGELAAIPTLAVSGLLSRWQRLEGPAASEPAAKSPAASEPAAESPALEAARAAFPEARALLARRRFTDDVVNEARKLMADSAQSAPSEEALARALVNVYEPAERDLWGYYLQWSPVFRKVIKDKNLLRKLGLIGERD